MITAKDFDELVAAVAEANSLPIEEAGRIVSEVGDTPELNDAGKVVFEGRVLVWPE